MSRNAFLASMQSGVVFDQGRRPEEGCSENRAAAQPARSPENVIREGSAVESRMVDTVQSRIRRGLSRLRGTVR